MRQILVTGSTVVDVVLRVPELPRRGEDVNISASTLRIGGCAWNVYKALRRFAVPALLCSPVGTGIYGLMVRERLEREGITPFVSLEEENGCCYCLVEKDGERSFLSLHGAEYRFDRRWITSAAAAGRLDLAQSGGLFICGIDVEDPTGEEIVAFAAEYLAGPAASGGPRLYFAPGPRIRHIPRSRLDRLMALGPFLHLNETETCAACELCAAGSFNGGPDVSGAARALAAFTGNSVVITLGAQGCYFFAQQAAPQAAAVFGHVPALPVTVADTVGAGDAHCGAVIAGLALGKSLEEACKAANQSAARIVSGRDADFE